ncbi:MAG: diacylglycerol kinase family lipid kinase [Saprospiraceae bacterium]|nr:diacylglycerol kinase family lipid kinase [Saprospiraceae bacterium]
MELSELKWFTIINPLSGGGKATKLWKKLKPLIESSGVNIEFAETKFHKHAVELVQAALQAGGRHILIIGGDGSANEVVNGIMQYADRPEEITVAMISVGTGNDWVRTIGAPDNLDAVARSLKANQSFLHDVGIIEYYKNKISEKRYFINIAGIGFDGLVTYKVSKGMGAFNKSKFRYWIGILQTLFSYKHTMATYTIDGKICKLQTLSVAAGICNYNGGGMKQLPFAKYNDGLLDISVIGEMSKLKMIFSLPKLRNGSFVNMAAVKTFQAKEIVIHTAKPIRVEADGEYLGFTPVNIRIIPDCISILVWK